MNAALKIFNIHEAKTHLSRLVPVGGAGQQRRLGGLAGQVRETPGGGSQPLDSHALLWALADPDQLEPEAAHVIRDPGRAVFFSAASVWELALKAAKGKLVLPANWLDAAREAGFLELPVTAAEAEASAGLPWHHADPFDRVLVAQAREHHLRIATRDPLITPYGVPVLAV